MARHTSSDRSIPSSDVAGPLPTVYLASLVMAACSEADTGRCCSIPAERTITARIRLTSGRWDKTLLRVAGVHKFMTPIMTLEADTLPGLLVMCC
jgi:hypothetical protein